jgi:DNA-binding transcriptional regulator YiaG
LSRSHGIRRRLKLTVEAFAQRYRIPAELVRAWEDGTTKPDAVADAYLRAIAANPGEVAVVVSGKTAAE